MLRTGRALDPHGVEFPIEGAISRPLAQALKATIAERKPSVTVEIGMACGVSTLAILSGLDAAGGSGRLLSIDPHQSTQWRGCGKAAVARAHLDHRHELIEEFSHVALPRMLAAGTILDFAYIDGWHTFDYALMDFWFIDKMLAVGGIVAFNDCSFAAVDKVVRFVMTHRAYDEIEVGLPLKHAGITTGREVRRLLRRLPRRQFYPRHGDRYFVKRAAWEPSWNYFAEF